MLYRTGFEFETCLWMSPLKQDISQAPKSLKVEKLCINCGGIRYHYSKILESDNPYCFANISAS